MRILQLYPKQDYFTGAAIQLRDLAVGLATRGHDVVVATGPSEVWMARMREVGVTHYALPMDSALDLRSVRALVGLLRRHRVDIVHAHKGRARTLALMAGLVQRIPVLILNRGVSFPLDRFNRLGYTTRRVAAIVAVCQSIKRQLVQAGVDPAKIEVIYSGTDTRRFHPGVDGAAVRRALGLAPHHFLVTQIGVRAPKGNDDVLDAMAKLGPRFPDARLLLVGAKPGEIVALEEHAAARGIERLVHVFGHRDDIPEILAATDVSVDASWVGHGVTGALRESLAVGTPVIGTDLEGNPELITHGETGLLVPPRDPSALAEAIVTMIMAPDRGRAMGRRGRALVEARFSTEIKLARMEALYHRLLGERAA